MVLSFGIFSHFADTNISGTYIDRVSEHSITVGLTARTIAERENLPQALIEDASMAGVLHDIGKLVLAINFPNNYSNLITFAAEKRLPLCELEYKFFQISHAEIGAYLISLWGFQNSIVEALAFHHRPYYCPDKDFSLLTAVHIANALSHRSNNVDNNILQMQIERTYLAQLGLGGRISQWLGMVN